MSEVVEEAALLHHQLARVLRAAPEIPAERARAGRLGVDADRLVEMRALVGFGEILVLDPLQAVARDLPVRLLHGGDGFGVARERGRDAIDGERNVLAREQPPDAPEAGARAIFVDRLHVHVASARPRLRADDLRQERLRRRIAVQDVVLAALLVVEDELHGDRAPPGHFGSGGLRP